MEGNEGNRQTDNGDDELRMLPVLGKRGTCTSGVLVCDDKACGARGFAIQ